SAGSSTQGVGGSDGTGGGSLGVGGADLGAGGTNASSDGGPTSGAGGNNVMPPLPDGGPIEFKLDCGASGVAIEGHGPPDNRVNYVIVGDCYSQADIDGGLFVQHIKKMIDDPTRKPAAG